LAEEGATRVKGIGKIEGRKIGFAPSGKIYVGATSCK